MKNKVTAGLLALLLGWFGVHKFYLDRPGQGILYLLFCWTFIPALLGFIEGIVYLTMSDQDFNAKYNRGLIVPAAPAPTIIQVTNTNSGRSLATELKELKELRDGGDLTEDEFQTQKRRLLGTGA